MTALPSQVIFASAYRQLTPTERTFVDNAVADLDRAASDRRERISNALYRPIPDHIVQQSRGMLEKPLVCAAITERINEIAAASELSVQRIMREYMAIAFATIGNYMHHDGDVMDAPYFDLTRCTPEQLAAIKSLDVEETGNGFDRGKRKVKITLHDKMAALKALAEFTGMLQPDNPHWRADMAKPADAMLPGDATVEQAGDAYAALIGG